MNRLSAFKHRAKVTFRFGPGPRPGGVTFKELVPIFWSKSKRKSKTVASYFSAKIPHQRNKSLFTKPSNLNCYKRVGDTPNAWFVFIWPLICFRMPLIPRNTARHDHLSPRFFRGGGHKIIRNLTLRRVMMTRGLRL